MSQLLLNFLFARFCRCFTIVVATSNLAFRNFIPSENSLPPLPHRCSVAQLRKLRIQVQSSSLRCGALLCNLLKSPLTNFVQLRIQVHYLQLCFRCSLCNTLRVYHEICSGNYLFSSLLIVSRIDFFSSSGKSKFR